MNLIKSFFIFLAPAWLIFIVVQALTSGFSSGKLILYSAVSISALPLLLFLSYIMVFKKLARTSEHLLTLSIPSLMACLLVLGSFLKNSDYNHMLAMVYSLSAFMITFLYIYWYSDNKRMISKSIKNNQQLPDFSILDNQGNTISSTSFIGGRSLIFFYRGNWCPLCMAQIDEISQQYKQFEKHNINVIFISPQPSKNTKLLAEKFNLSFQFYIDKHNHAAKQLGISHRFGLPMGFQALGYESDSVYPTVIAIDQHGMIIYNDQTSNYRLRPEPQDLLEIFI